MKKTITAFCICLILALFISQAAYAATPIDPERTSSLTLQYRYGENCFEGLQIQTFRVAEVFADGTYALCGDFRDYPVNIYGITSQGEWNTIASTLAAYAAADQLQPACTAMTDETGTVAFTDILPGMYLTLAVKVETQARITQFESFLTVVPYPSEDGDHNYDVTAYPKCSVHTPEPGELEYKVVKQWKDDGNTAKRPEYVEVDILKDGVVAFTQKLSSDNHWSYSWTAPDDGSKWQAVERNVPADYTVTVVENGNTIIITNVYEGEPIDPPPTGDTTVLWPFAIVMGLSGGIAMILAVWFKRKEG